MLKLMLENSENDNVDKLKSNPHKTTVEKTIMPRKTNIWGSSLGIFLVKKIPIKKLNGKPPIIIKTIAIQSMVKELKYPRESLWLEKPPVETVVIAWTMASNIPIPAM